ncbi:MULTISPECIES: plasmid replication protein RepC [unclassified Rhizobium]|uniref:plasmid replication protein RepC n=1 Tax=unclassified Rhizobium TaxID=2613769 RepID=UPI001ADB04D4|nr:MULTISPECIES: plasmid replication protein RepC [unclassified Rhizobium]MBO9127433.1 replication initiation protein RepC [Rhizobium sp. 16-488-2b]MBO9177876.1 replication initiation protein RepC [Rhizobium sp. 16-488-2a]
MHVGDITTPFGRRPMTLALMKRQAAAAKIESGSSVDKWKVFRDASEARALLGIQDRALAVLNALLTFYPESELASDRAMIVFPSNAQLSIRAHGITGTTLRRHLAALVDAGLILRRDSANGKRYARKDRAGEIEQAYGFDLSPLLARASELAVLSERIATERALFRSTKETLSICRRDVRKLISAAIVEDVSGNWQAIESRYVELVGSIPRTPSLQDLRRSLESIENLRQTVLNLLENKLNSEKMDAYDIGSGCHIQNSNTESIIEIEQQGAEREAESGSNCEKHSEPTRSFPLSMVLRACPEITSYGPGGSVSSWRELMEAAVLVRSMLGVTPGAYRNACEIMGPENAAATMACILQRAEHIKSAGGYLRDLTARAQRREFSLGPVLMALLRANGGKEPAAV